MNPRQGFCAVFPNICSPSLHRLRSFTFRVMSCVSSQVTNFVLNALSSVIVWRVSRRAVGTFQLTMGLKSKSKNDPLNKWRRGAQTHSATCNYCRIHVIIDASAYTSSISQGRSSQIKTLRHTSNISSRTVLCLKPSDAYHLSFSIWRHFYAMQTNDFNIRFCRVNNSIADLQLKSLAMCYGGNLALKLEED